MEVKRGWVVLLFVAAFVGLGIGVWGLATAVSHEAVASKNAAAAEARKEAAHDKAVATRHEVCGTLPVAQRNRCINPKPIVKYRNQRIKVIIKHKTTNVGNPVLVPHNEGQAMTLCAYLVAPTQTGRSDGDHTGQNATNYGNCIEAVAKADTIATHGSGANPWG